MNKLLLTIAFFAVILCSLGAYLMGQRAGLKTGVVNSHAEVCVILSSYLSETDREEGSLVDRLATESACQILAGTDAGAGQAQYRGISALRELRAVWQPKKTLWPRIVYPYANQKMNYDAEFERIVPASSE